MHRCDDLLQNNFVTGHHTGALLWPIIIPEISVGIKFGDYKPQIAIAKTLVDLNLVVVKVDCQTAKNFWLYTHTLCDNFFLIAYLVCH